MLTITKDDRGFVVVREDQFSFSGTVVVYWYYDLDNKLVSSFGNKNDIPDHPMTAEMEAWVHTHYLPKLEKV